MTRLQPIRAALPIVIAGASLLGSAALAAEPVLDSKECWNALNELAAAAVFSDLEEETMEKVYTHLDALQDHCADARMAEAMQEIGAIEAIIGK